MIKENKVMGFIEKNEKEIIKKIREVAGLKVKLEEDKDLSGEELEKVEKRVKELEQEIEGMMD